MPKKENGNFTEAELRAFTGEVPVASESKKQTEQSGLSPVTIRSTDASPLAEATGDEQGEESLFPAVREDAEYPLRLYLPRRLTRHPQQCDG